jgi:hypothetical protein
MRDVVLTPNVSSPSATVTLLDRALGPSENCPGRLSMDGESVDSSVSDGVDCWVGEEYVLFVSRLRREVACSDGWEVTRPREHDATFSSAKGGPCAGTGTNTSSARIRRPADPSRGPSCTSLNNGMEGVWGECCRVSTHIPGVDMVAALAIPRKM